MGRFRWTSYDGQVVLEQDFSGLNKSNLMQYLDESQEVIEKKGERDIIVLTNIEQSKFDRSVSRAFERVSLENKAYVKASLVVGVSTLQKVAIESVGKLTGRQFKVFKDKPDAQDWIRNQ